MFVSLVTRTTPITIATQNVIHTAFRYTRSTASRRFCQTSSSSSPSTTTHQCADNNKLNTERPVRVRFAPSPTGYLHLGGLRTALYNYLFAKANRGTFILRIEDTDQSRLVPDAIESLFKELEWAGIRPDESVLHGGNHGPYVQSERLDIYRREVKKLLENGSAYYCFCTERRLELLRKDAIRANISPKYDNRCRHLTPVQVAEKLANHDPMCIRFKLESTITSFTDMVYGKHEYDVANNEGDPIIIKSDGFPTYHFANVVDDHFMEISHVLRGVEWQTSTEKHLLMYQAFGWTPPQYAHLPLILNSDGSKLSKRHGNANLEYYRSKGIFPLALLNYITLSGGGFERKQKGQKPRVYSLPELIETFNINLLLSHSSCLSTDMLEDCNRLVMVEMLKDPVASKQLVEQVKGIVLQAFPQDIHNLDLDDEHIQKILDLWTNCRLSSLHQLVEVDFQFLWILPDMKDVTVDLDIDFVKLIDLLERTEFAEETLLATMRSFCNEHKLKVKSFMMSMRTLLSGKKDGPGVHEMMATLGKKTTIQRLQRILPKKSKSK